MAGKKDMCVIGVSDTSYKQDHLSVAGEIIMIGNFNEKGWHQYLGIVE